MTTDGENGKRTPSRAGADAWDELGAADPGNLGICHDHRSSLQDPWLYALIINESEHQPELTTAERRERIEIQLSVTVVAESKRKWKFLGSNIDSSPRLSLPSFMASPRKHRRIRSLFSLSKVFGRPRRGRASHGAPSSAQEDASVTSSRIDELEAGARAVDGAHAGATAGATLAQSHLADAVLQDAGGSAVHCRRDTSVVPDDEEANDGARFRPAATAQVDEHVGRLDIVVYAESDEAHGPPDIDEVPVLDGDNDDVEPAVPDGAEDDNEQAVLHSGGETMEVPPLPSGNGVGQVLAPNDGGQRVAGPVEPAAAAGMVDVIIRAVCDMLNYFAVEWVDIVDHTGPSFQDATRTFLGVFIYIDTLTL
ncbi:hypothetical protein AURDEDRAFT_131875 [Auricularia subglabra TFB-10046 SS5]|uniref:Uncharacterized protein n=1 Tax=Auricularia subglabra (strain TFB-10046 / SS5) TaxID=717982 RepID=J0CS23_AURST|nr:hypothetical protein AURDEDRAFT_131875 [Auricularia subglabra TFB-10046 SS5]